MSTIELKNVSFAYAGSKVKVLDNISLIIENASINTILGLNGSGKTTLIKLITGLLNPTYGSVAINNVDLSDISIYQRSKAIAYVPQLQKLDSDYLVIDYLSFGMSNKISYYSYPKEKHLLEVYKYAKEFNITHLLEKKIDQISGGERQIVSICNAFIQNTPVIILDEPMSALDFSNQAMILKLLKHCARDGKTIILTSHNPNHALNLGGKVIVVHNQGIPLQGESRLIITIKSLRPIYGDNIVNSSDLDYPEISIKQ